MSQQVLKEALRRASQEDFSEIEESPKGLPVEASLWQLEALFKGDRQSTGERLPLPQGVFEFICLLLWDSVEVQK